MLLYPRNQEAKDAINTLYPKGDVGRDFIIILRARRIISQGFNQLLAMDVTPEMKEKILSIEQELNDDANFIFEA